MRYGTTGKPVPGYELKLLDELGEPCKPGEIGDLYIKGPSAALMYWCNRDKSRDTFVGAWTRSGDKYLQDADGYYVYAGRSDDMLKVGASMSRRSRSRPRSPASGSARSGSDRRGRCR